MCTTTIQPTLQFQNKSFLMIVYICKVNGGWTAWTTWSGCQILCKGAWKTRYRSCTNPVPLYTGDTCPGSQDDYQPCDYKFMKRGTPYMEDRINHLKPKEIIGDILSKSISKIGCILKCKLRSDCLKSGFIAQDDNSGTGTCYKIRLDNNNELDSIDEEFDGGGLMTFSIVRPAPPGNDENAGYRGFC